MNIPGTKLVEKALIALPSHARLESENRDLRLKSSNDDARIKALEAQLAELQPVAGVEVEAAKILRILFDRDDLVALAEIIELTGLKQSMAKYHLDNLSGEDFTRDRGDLYEIRPKGREFIMKNGLA